MNEPKSIDDVVSAFFKSETPNPWPQSPRIPAGFVAVAAANPISRSSRSRVALTASVLALLIGGWVLAGRVSRMPDRPTGFEGTTATRPAELRMPR